MSTESTRAKFQQLPSRFAEEQFIGKIRPCLLAQDRAGVGLHFVGTDVLGAEAVGNRRQIDAGLLSVLSIIPGRHEILGRRRGVLLLLIYAVTLSLLATFASTGH